MARKLNAEDLAWHCPDTWLPWKLSTEIQPAETIVGQDRAVEAIAFGLAMSGVGYNVFVTGMSGSGRLTTIKSFLDQLAVDEKSPDDVCFVYNFSLPEEPRVLFLNAGAGRRLRDSMEELVDDLAENLPGIFNSQEFRRRLDGAVGVFQEKEKALLEKLEAEVEKAGFSLVQIQVGPVTRPEILPVVEDEPVAMEDLQPLKDDGKLSDDDFSKLQEQYGVFKERLQEAFLVVADLRRQAQERVEELRREIIQPTFDEAVERVAKQVAEPRADAYLKAVRADLPEYMDLFAPGEEHPMDRFLRWRVNLSVDNADVVGRPVILETEPTYSNLFGTIERTLLPSGEAVTSFVRIRAGSLMRANGGFLVLNAEDLLMESRVWPGLKRALKYRRVSIQTMESIVLGAAGLKPEEVPLDVKVVVIGDRRIYDMLYRHDPDFAKIFKVLADFDAVMPATADRARDLLSVLVRVAEAEELAAMDRSGMAAILEHAVRAARWRRRFSSRFSDLSDALREAAYQAKKMGAEHISREHVQAASRARKWRHGLSEDRTHELIADGVIRVETAGEVVGQVNGLAVYDLGHHRFGKPSRITARVGIGREGVINVERNAGLSGPTHDKGIQILTGFLRGTFARSVPLTISCSVTFEQSYGGIDGDSASSTEIYAILSALADLPLRQDIAVTGSVDQFGRIQAIGGVNEKIRGFFRVCESHGLSGTQGVMVPASNVNDLELDQEVAEAVENDRYHVWAVETVEEGIELLSGCAAGDWEDAGAWTEGSVYDRCQARLEEMVRLLRNAGKEEAATDEENGNGEENADEESTTD